MASMKYKEKHNQVALLTKITGFEDFHPIVDFMKSTKLRYALTADPIIYDSLVRQFWSTATVSKDGKQIIATIDNRKVTVTEDNVRNKLRLEDNGGINNLPDEDIFKGLGSLGYVCNGKLTFYKRKFSPQLRYLIHTILHCLCSKSGSADQFASQTATALICISNGTVYNFSKMIFDGMAQNAGNKKKFLMYPRFLQLILDITPHDKGRHKIHYVTQKAFSFLRKNVDGEVAALPPAMLVGETHSEGDASPIRQEQENLDNDSARNTSEQPNNTSHAEPCTSSTHNHVVPPLVDVPVNELPSTPIVATATSQPIESAVIHDLKKELKATKNKYGKKIRKLSKRVKELETSVNKKHKRRRIVLSDSEPDTSEPVSRLWLLTVASEYAKKADSKHCNVEGNSVEFQDALDGPKDLYDSGMLTDVIPNSTVSDNPNPSSNGCDGNVNLFSDVNDISGDKDLGKGLSNVVTLDVLNPHENSGIEKLDGLGFVNSNKLGSAETEVSVAEEGIGRNIPVKSLNLLGGCSANEKTDRMGVSSCVDCSVTDNLPSECANDIQGTSQTSVASIGVDGCFNEKNGVEDANVKSVAEPNPVVDSNILGGLILGNNVNDDPQTSVADVNGLSTDVDACSNEKSGVEHGSVKSVEEPNPVVDSNMIGGVIIGKNVNDDPQTSVADVNGLSTDLDACSNEKSGVEHGSVKSVEESNPVVDSNMIGGVIIGKNVNDDPRCKVFEIDREVDIKSFDVTHKFPVEEAAEMKELQEKITHDWLVAKKMDNTPESDQKGLAEILELAKHFNKAEWEVLVAEAQSCPYLAANMGINISDLKVEDQKKRLMRHSHLRVYMRCFLKNHGSLPMSKSKDLTDKELTDLYKSRRRWNEFNKPIGIKEYLKKPETVLTDINKGQKTMSRKVKFDDMEKNELRPLLITEGKSESQVHIPLPCEAIKKDDVVWDSQKSWTVVSWKLHNLTGLHTIKTDTGLVIHMLVSEKYPLKMHNLLAMLEVKLETDRESSMAFELLKSIQRQCQETPDEEVVEKLDVIDEVKILYKGKNSAAFQIIRKSGVDDMYKSVDAIMRGISRIDLFDLYKVLKNCYAKKGKQDPHGATLYEYLKTMIETPPDENFRGMSLNQKVMGWIYFDSCGVHCLKLETLYIYMLIERRYPLPVHICKEMLGVTLMGKQDQVYSQIMQRIWNQAYNA